MIKKGKINFSELDFAKGEVILIDKKLDRTSFDAVYHIRKLVNVKKVGHAGSLDPKATGLLIICTGKKTKEISKYQDREKTYTGVIELGKVSSTMDTEGELIDSPAETLLSVTEKKIYTARDSFLGKTFQKAPMFSAVKHKGKALYKYARKGVEIEREPREIFISKFEIEISLPEIRFELTCSKGTYIRAIAGDFGDILGCGAYLKELRRIKIGEFSVDEAFTIDELKEAFQNIDELKSSESLNLSS